MLPVAKVDDPFPRTGTIAVPEISFDLGGGCVVCVVRSGMKDDALHENA